MTLESVSAYFMFYWNLALAFLWRSSGAIFYFEIKAETLEEKKKTKPNKKTLKYLAVTMKRKLKKRKKC